MFAQSQNLKTDTINADKSVQVIRRSDRKPTAHTGEVGEVLNIRTGVDYFLEAARNAVHKNEKRSSYGPVRTLILGTGTLADRIVTHIKSDRAPGYLFCGYVNQAGGANGFSHALGDVKRLVEIVERENIECVVAALAERRGYLPLEQLLALKLNGVKVEDGVAFYEKISGKIPLAGLNPSALIFGEGFDWPTKAAKRAVDLVLSLFCLALTAPLFVVLPILIKLTSRGPVFYRQERAGLHGRRFTLLKFRSMRDNAENPGTPVWATEGDPRTTALGGFMRKFRLDELPQMLNVLQGSMSVVGPRPERPEFIQSLQHEIPYYTLRLMVKPGITGWAQVMFRYGASIKDTEEKLQFDLYYIKHMSVAFDFRIAFKTVRTVLLGEGGR